MPRLKLGNVIVMPQPNRGSRRDREKDISHDKKVPLHHAYRAVYHYIVDGFKSDAIVHVGTHGTQEWLAGKERGLWAYDDSYSTIGSVPVVYPYSVANTGEALIAKRRGQAVVISHNTPPFAPAGLYGDLVDVHDKMHQIGELEEGRVKEETKKSMVAQVVSLDFHKDMNLTEEQIWQDFEGFTKKLHDYLLELAATAQPMGLHHFGSIAETDHLLLTVFQMLDKDYIQAADGVEPSHVLAQEYQKIYKTKSFNHLKDFLINKQPLNSFSAEVQIYLKQAQVHYDNFLAEKEIESLLDGLAAKHISTGTGNDPIRNPEAVPTGKNIYGFDPTKIPTKAAWEAGKALATDLIESYKSKHGMYPDKLAFSMWSTETLKHFGVLEAEILYTIGVRPVWNERDQVKDVEIIPMDELKRPRIDVVLSATGLYRDNLPGVMDRLSQAIVKVAKLKEPQNYVNEHTEQLKEGMLAKSLSEEEASKYSRVRFFANESGVYGTNLPDATLASDTWENDESMVKTYLSRMGHLFGTEAGTRNVKLKNFDLFAENLKGTKAAVLSRSSNLHGILSIDHPFEYLGGIGQAVRYLDGKTPELYIANLRDTKNFKNETAAEFIAKEMRTRYYHPNWVKEMMDEGYSGALEIVDVVNNFWGWNVMSPEAVRADQWQEMFEIYVEDKLELGVDEWFKEVQPAAIAQISERMLEAVRKDYWDASDKTVKALVEKYIEIIKEHDVYTPNQKFKDFLEAKAVGFGLDISALKELAERQANPEKQQTEATSSSETVQVEGVKLEKQPEQQVTEDDDMSVYWLSLILFLLV
ncbi:MAG: cobaltochelatase subunit CobN, partial [Gammaproteobacteria bacterium]|nr:cobaltochelatase subunit CobN [Gammaproteobacteria bacterium]